MQYDVTDDMDRLHVGVIKSVDAVDNLHVKIIILND
jgi:hypothetical protein